MNNKTGVDPKDISKLVEIVLDKKLSVTPEEIKELAQQIEDALRNLKNVDQILKDTQEDKLNAQKLKEEAERAR